MMEFYYLIQKHPLLKLKWIFVVFSDECKKQNIQFGFYYSWFEFGVPFTKIYFKNYCVPQLEELLKYEPNYMWFDGYKKANKC